MKLLRTMMFVPGNKSKMVDKAATARADGVFLDLEDSVPAAEKETARALVREALTRGSEGPELWVRTNGITTGLLATDLDAVVTAGLTGVLLPKVEEPAQVVEASRLIAERESKAGLPAGTVGLVPILETARGIVSAVSIASADKRVVALCFGAEDFTADMGTSRSRAGTELFVARSNVVLAAVAAGIQSIDTVFSDLADEEGLVADAKLARQLGFTGKCLIHPKQIEPVVAVFSPSEAEIAYARRVVEAYQAAVARGSGAVSLDGKMVDTPVVMRAQRILTIAEALR